MTFPLKPFLDGDLMFLRRNARENPSIVSFIFSNESTSKKKVTPRSCRYLVRVESRSILTNNANHQFYFFMDMRAVRGKTGKRHR